MKQLFYTLLFLLLPALTINAQQRNKKLIIQVTSVEGDHLNGQSLTLMQTDYQVSYGSLALNADGQCSLNVYAGNHALTLERSGFNPVAYNFTVGEEETEKTIQIELTEKTRQPFALQTKTDHDVMTGKNSISLSWNTEEPAFFDDFESYAPFSINFGQWTGIDADQEAAAPLVGTYPNRGTMQYAQVINPLTVDPTWWYDYPILRPYSGKQYIGFTRTYSGNANDDWLISPTINVGTENVLSFLVKAADRFSERFMVYVTTQLNQPTQSDFTRLDQDNYETADYTGWKECTYDLSAYAGQQVKFAIRYISHYNRYGSFMLMLDDVYVGQNLNHTSGNPNEQFQIFLDGQLVGTTKDTNYTLTDIENGPHTIGVQACYLKAQSELTTQQVNIPSGIYSHVVFHFTTNSRLNADGQIMTITNTESLKSYDLTVTNSQVEMISLPNGSYVINIEEGAFQHYQQMVTVDGDANFDITLNDLLMKPYNITATCDDNGIYTLRWNQNLIFSDSFEDYNDFSAGTFGEWKTIDRDLSPVYPIALGSASNIVSFPGSGTASTPMPIAPMVFNPWSTTPAMLPSDPAIAAPTGDKSVIFFSSQMAQSDDWLISPLLDIHDNYKLSLKAKAYSAMYPESLEFCVSDGSSNPNDFTVISYVESVPAEHWSLFDVDLSRFAGQSVRLAVHYTSYDAFLTQIDDFTVGPEDGQGEVVDYGNVVRFEISVDGTKVGESQIPTFVLPPLSAESHIIGIKAIYQSGESETAEYVINGATGIAHKVLLPTDDAAVYSLSGVYMGNQVKTLPSGIYVVKNNGKTVKIRK